MDKMDTLTGRVGEYSPLIAILPYDISNSYRPSPDPFFTISPVLEDDNTSKIVYKSEIITNNINPEWKPFQLNIKDIPADSDKGTDLQDILLLVRCLDNKANGRLIGERQVLGIAYLPISLMISFVPNDQPFVFYLFRFHLGSYCMGENSN